MHKNYQLIVLPGAQQDMREIVLYIANQLKSPYAALRLKNEFKKAISSLSELPERFQIIKEKPWNNKGVRKLQVKNYFIYYVIIETEKAVKIIAVIYVRRNQESIIKDKIV